MQDVKKGALGLVATLGSTAIAVFGFVKTSANAADAITDLAKASGISARALQELGAFAQLNGSSLEDVASGVRFLNRALIDAQNPASETAKLFRKMGISAIDPLTGKTKDAKQAFIELSSFFEKTEDSALKTDVAMTLLGRSGTKLIGSLERGPEAIAAFIAANKALFISDDALDKLGKFNDSLDTLFLQFRSISLQVAAELSPSITGAVGALSKFINENVELLKQVGSNALKGFVNFFVTLTEIFIRFSNVLLPIIARLTKIPFLVESILTVMTLLSGALILKGLFAMGAALKGIALAAAAANAPFLLWAAALGAVLLVLDDIAAWWNGEDSVLGLMIEKFQSLLDTIRGFSFFKDLNPFFNATVGDRVGAGDLTRNSNLTNQNASVKVEAPISVTVGEGVSAAQVGQVMENSMNNLANQITISAINLSTGVR